MKHSTNTLRRLLALVLVLVMVGTLFAGCNKKNPDPTDPSEPSEPTTQVTDPTEEPTDPTEEPTEEPTEPTVTVPPVTMGTVNADNLNVRAEPYSTADILKRLAINTRIEIEEQKIVDGVNWGRVAEGWVNLNYVTIDGEGTGTGTVIDNDNNIGSGTNVNTDVNKTYNGVITTTELHIREDADADSKSVGTYKKGDKVVIIGQRDGWGKTDKGWINMKYVDIGGTTSGSTGSSSTGSSTAGSNTGSVSNGNKIALGTGTVINTTSLAVRSGPGTNYAKVSFVRLGETHSYYQTSGNWIRLSNGWVNSNYMELEYNIASGTVGTVNTGELNVRENPDADSKSLATVKKGDEVTILEVKGTWGKIEYQSGDFGWINLDYVKFATASSTYTTGEYTVTADALHYRKEANADSTALGTYKKDDKVTVTEVAGNWGKTDKGWINLKYTTATEVYSTGTGKVTASSLNVRDKASTSGKDIGSLKKGDKVTILDVEGNWGKIDYKGKTGWISLKYVEMDPAAKYTVTVASGITNGEVKVSSSSYAKGTVVSLTVTPKDGYELESLTYTPKGGSATAITGNKFTMPAANVTINASFKAVTTKYTVTINTATNGSVTASTTSCAEGTVVTLTAKPNSGYVLASLSALNTSDNSTVDIDSGNKFTMPAGNVNIVATFRAATSYKVTVNPTTNGKVTASTTAAEEGATITLTVSPNEGYELESLTVVDASNNPVDVTDNKFTMPAKDVSVAAKFKIAEYAVEITPPTNGSVSVNPSTYQEGQTVTLNIDPDDGYELDKVNVNGKDISGTAFAMPASKASVTVTFKKIQYKVTVGTISNGTVTVKDNKSTAGINDEVELEVAPATDYELKSLTYTPEGGTATAITGNKFTMPAKNVTINATFEKKAVVTRTITVYAKDINGNPVTGVSFVIAKADLTSITEPKATSGSNGSVTFTTNELKNIADGTVLVAEVKGNHEYDWGTNGANSNVRNATAGTISGNAVSVVSNGNQKDLMFSGNESSSFEGSYTVIVKAKASSAS